MVMDNNLPSTYRKRRTSVSELSTLSVSEFPPAVMYSPPENEVRKIVSSQRDSQLSSSVAPTEDVVYDITSNSVDGDSGKASTTGHIPARTDGAQISLQSQNTLLEHVFKGTSLKLPHPQFVCARRDRIVLERRIGCDFTLVVNGVQFYVHSAFLIGGSQVLEDYMFPTKSTSEPPTREYEFDAQIHSPIMVDRLIEFIYTGTYTLDQGGRATLLRHHSKLPRGLTSASYPMNLESALEFHLKMYNMGKNLQYQSLVAISHTKMAEAMLWTSKLGVGVGIVKKFVTWAYDPAQNVQDTDERANDTFGDDSLKELVVACVLRHIHQELWDESAIADFRDYVKGFPALEVDGELAEEEYKDLLKTRPGAKRAMKRARRGQQH